MPIKPRLKQPLPWLGWLIGAALLAPFILIVASLKIWPLVIAAVTGVTVFVMCSFLILRLRFGNAQGEWRWPWYVPLVAGGLSGIAFGFALRAMGEPFGWGILTEAMFFAVWWWLMTGLKWPEGWRASENSDLSSGEGEAATGTHFV